MIELYASYTALFLLTVLILYVLIKVSKEHLTLLFVLIPVVVCTGLIAGWAVKSLHGIPIKGYPEEKIVVLSVTVEKPSMFIVVREIETNKVKLHAVPYTKESSRMLQNIDEMAQQKITLEGRFNVSESMVEFIPDRSRFESATKIE